MLMSYMWVVEFFLILKAQGPGFDTLYQSSMKEKDAIKRHDEG